MNICDNRVLQRTHEDVRTNPLGDGSNDELYKSTSTLGNQAKPGPHLSSSSPHHTASIEYLQLTAVRTLCRGRRD
jgi:hypothetical protein